ncbi:MAG TPA: heat-inducible transcriptional repressor HrcA [Gaiellaceae bacterium]|nr:heat-inducible transcriptional repressor HrcA [Gaiellaceae bacterium]
MTSELTTRQRKILRLVVEEYVSTGQPVGSKALVERTALHVSSSTVRNDLAELEQTGMLTHPHTSAGRVPTKRGYRFYADVLLDELEPRPRSFPLDLTVARNEVEAALQATTEMLSQVTQLLALVSAPPLASATVRHVEVLLLQPSVVMVVVITSTGGVTKRVHSFAEPVDPGLAEWAGAYLNDQVAGLQLGTHTLRRRFDDASLSARERAFLDVLRPAFTQLVSDEEQRLYIGGAAGLLVDARAEDIATYQALLEVLEQRAAMLDVLAEALDPRRPFVRVGEELEHPALRELALVGACYGLTNRPLGSVSIVGPLRMDYGKAIASVRAAASELSRFVEEVYAEP